MSGTDIRCPVLTSRMLVPVAAMLGEVARGVRRGGQEKAREEGGEEGREEGGEEGRGREARCRR
eukprot:1171808-Rhodomonas_salina.4